MRIIDRYVGIPLVGLLAARRLVRRPLPRAPRRVGIMKTAGIGDTVLLSAIARDLAATGAEVVLFTGGENAAVGRLIAGVHEVVPLSLKRPWVAARQVRGAGVDLLLDCGPWPRINAVLSAVSGAHTAGFRSPGQARHFAYDTVVEHRRDVHEIENYRNLARAAGLRPMHPPALAATGEARPLVAPRSSYVVLHAWPGGTASHLREWATDRWVTLARALSDHGYAVVLTGAPSDRPRSAELAAAMTGHVAELVDAAGMLSLAEVAGLVRFATLVVSVNTGIMHMSAVQGVPTISLDGPTNSDRWGPVGPRAEPVRSVLPGCGYLHYGWEHAGRRADCMEGIAIDAVLTAARRLLGTTPDDGWRPDGCCDSPGLAPGSVKRPTAPERGRTGE